MAESITEMAAVNSTEFKVCVQYSKISCVQKRPTLYVNDNFPIHQVKSCSDISKFFTVPDTKPQMPN